jgi:hypothetical protein
MRHHWRGFTLDKNDNGRADTCGRNNIHRSVDQSDWIDNTRHDCQELHPQESLRSNAKRDERGNLVSEKRVRNQIAHKLYGIQWTDTGGDTAEEKMKVMDEKNDSYGRRVSSLFGTGE